MNEQSSIVFTNREAAGRLLATRLHHFKDLPGVVVVSLPQSGIIVACEVARSLQAQLELTFIRRFGLAAAAGRFDGPSAIRRPDAKSQERDPVFQYCMDGLLNKQHQDSVKREAFLRSGYRAQSLTGRTVILVDDGCASAQHLHLALKNIWLQRPSAVSLALPIVSHETARDHDLQLADLIYLVCTDSTVDAAKHYKNFPPVEDHEVKAILARSRTEAAEGQTFAQSACV